MRGNCIGDSAEPTDGGQETEVRVRAAQILQLYSHSQWGLVGAFFSAVGLVMALWEVVPESSLLVWLEIYFTLQVLRYLLVAAFHRASPSGQETIRWGTWFAWLTVASGIVWGSTSIFLFPEHSLAHQFLLAIFVAGIAAAAAVVYSSTVQCFLPTIWAGLLPISVRYLHQGDGLSLIIGSLILVYAAVLSLTGRHIYRTNADSLRLRFDKGELVESLEKARSELELRVEERTDDLVRLNRKLQEEIERRELTEQELRDSQAKYRAILDSAEDSIFLKNRDLVYVHMNPAVSRLFGIPCSELVGKNDEDLFGPEAAADITEVDRRVLQGEIIEEEHTKPVQGTAKTFHVIKAPIRNDSGEITGICGIGRDVSERKAAQEQLRESEERYRDLFENATDMVYTCDLQGRFVSINGAAERIMGYSAGQLLALSFRDIVHPSYLAVAEGNFRRKVEDGIDRTGPYELLVLAGDETPIWIEVSTRIMKEDGRPVGVHGVARNITERKKAERQVRLNEARLESLYHITQYRVESIQELLDYALSEAIRLTESKAGYIFHYDEEQSLFELNTFSREVMKQCEVAEPRIVYELDRTGIWGEAVRQRKPIIINDFQASNPLEKGYPAGHVELHNFMTIPVFSGERIVAVVGVGNKDSDYEESDVLQLSLLMDSVWGIAKSKRAEAVQSRLATAVEHAAEGVMITGTDGTIQYVNKAFEQMTGYGREELIGDNPRILKSGLQDETFYDELWRTITRGEMWTGTIVNRRKDGALYTEESTISPVRDSTGAVINYVALKRDITQHLELHKQLLQAQKMESIGTLAGGIAHDFNNLLQVTLGYSELLLLEKAPGDPDYADLQKIFHAARSGAELVKRLLTFSRQIESKPIPLNLNRQITQVRQLLTRTIPKMVEIGLDLSADLPEINADPSQMEQVLMNLAVNARDAMPDGGKLVLRTDTVLLDGEYCSIHPEAKPGEHVVLEVSDNGHGMDKDTLEHIFDPFFTTKEIGRGTGLGLAMVHGIVKQHGGHVDCFSEMGKGTTFRLYFPAIPSVAEPTPEISGIMPAFGTETVLLVDDEDLVRELGERILAKSGYTVLTARNGVEALEVYGRERDRISLVILDLIMPTMGGKDCLKKTLEIEPRARILIASGYSADASTKEFTELGAKGFVAKPFRSKELLRLVRKTLDEE